MRPFGGGRWMWPAVLLLPLLVLVLVKEAACQTSSNLTESCVGVVLSYRSGGVTRTYPMLPKGDADQPYVFNDVLTVTNHGFEEVRNWQVFVGFLNRTVLVSAPSTVLADGSPLPAQVDNGTVLQGFPNGNLLTARETAGDLSKIQAVVNLKGTILGNFNSTSFPLPHNISFLNPGWQCGIATLIANDTLAVCCAEDKDAVNKDLAPLYSPRETGDVTLVYDVLQTNTGSYVAQVTMSNDNPLGRVDNWSLNWTWTEGEYIQWMKGAVTTEQDQADCINGEPGVENPGADFTKVVSCQITPTIVDLTPDKYNDSQVGQIPFCCRNGTLLPKIMDPMQSKSMFLLGVNKLQASASRDHLVPPSLWSIGERYTCSNPIVVEPSEFPDPTNYQRFISAVMTWQVTCNITVPSPVKTKCCVSFSAFYNDSVIPCPTCACGCPERPNPIYFKSPDSPQTCDQTGEALLLPTYELLVPFANRSRVAKSWAIQRKLRQPAIAPCGDNCPININWHIYSDYTTGWSARVTLFNWGNVSQADWFAAVQLNRSVAGYQNIYSFNGTKLTGDLNNTVFFHGFEGLNYLIGAQETNQGFDSGKMQSSISFTKKGINVFPPLDIAKGDGFPSQVIFNGEVCSLPDQIPSSAFSLRSPSSWLGACVVALLLLALGPGGIW